VISVETEAITTEGEMTNVLYDYDNSLVQQHIEELRREAAKARLARGARRNRRQRRQHVAAGGTLRPAQAC
jgi:hypothetical protein